VKPTQAHDELRFRTDALRRWLVDTERRGVTPGLQRLVGLPEWVAQLRRLEPEARRSIRVAQPQYVWDPEDPGVELIRKVRERGVETSLITRRATLDVHPLLPSVFPAVRIGPVFLGLLALDEEHFMIAGEDTVDGERTSWVSSRRDVGAAVLDIWRRTMALSEPVLPPGTPPPLTPRQLRVAEMLAVGEKDQSIAHRLSTSARTIERDVAAILHLLGARNRTEAVLLMRGRGVNGGRPEVQ
jgi:DNA-binding NarL/FixJ family response regulator